MPDPCGPQLTLHTSRRAHVRVSEWKVLGARVRRQLLEGALELPSEEPACVPLSSPAAPRVSKAPARPVMIVTQAAATGYDSTSTLMSLTPWKLAPVDLLSGSGVAHPRPEGSGPPPVPSTSICCPLFRGGRPTGGLA